MKSDAENVLMLFNDARNHTLTAGEIKDLIPKHSQLSHLSWEDVERLLRVYANIEHILEFTEVGAGNWDNYFTLNEAGKERVRGIAERELAVGQSNYLTFDRAAALAAVIISLIALFKNCCD